MADLPSAQSAGEIMVAGHRLRLYVRHDGVRLVDVEDFNTFVAAIGLGEIEVVGEDLARLQRIVFRGEAQHG